MTTFLESWRMAPTEFETLHFQLQQWPKNLRIFTNSTMNPHLPKRAAPPPNPPITPRITHMKMEYLKRKKVWVGPSLVYSSCKFMEVSLTIQQFRIFRGDMAGGGLVALPTAMIQLGIVFGMSFLLIMNLLTMFTSFMLGSSWNILVRRWPEYRTHCRKVSLLG